MNKIVERECISPFYSFYLFSIFVLLHFRIGKKEMMKKENKKEEEEEEEEKEEEKEEEEEE